MLAQLFSDKTLLIAITIIGIVMCTDGIGRVAANGQWLHPMSIAAYVIGVLVLVIAGAAVFDISLPLIDSPRTALVAVIVLGGIKIALTRVHQAIGQRIPT